MLDLPQDSDAETITPTQSSVSSSSSSDRSSNLSLISTPAPNPPKKSLLSLKSFTDFALVRKIGSGDIGTVHLCRLRDDPTSTLVYAVKVVDKESLRRRKKLERAETERKILRLLDHPFLMKVFADFDAEPCYSCVVMEYCSGGDLHSMRHRMPGRRFSIDAARFYAAEVLLALEYLHMLGIVYRDLKPENILIRSDGHVVLTDFDLSHLSTSSPSLVSTSSPTREPPQPSSCFPFLWSMKSSRPQVQVDFVAEPVDARSNSFVGTHEYVAPEIANGSAHSNAVDWWAYGVFLYEILYGHTPFVGPTKEATLKNIVGRRLEFPSNYRGPAHSPVQDLIAGLLAKDPKARVGSRFGAAEVKGHMFFEGVNFALVRSWRPPVVPGSGLERVGLDTKPERFEYF